jgi:GTPase Era involved in 16S rRNA processing
MKHSYAIVAVPVLVCGAVLAGTTQASARQIDPESDYRESIVFVDTPGPTRQVQVDDNVAEALQTGAGAVGGAGLVIAGLWMYRRRHPVLAH